MDALWGLAACYRPSGAGHTMTKGALHRPGRPQVTVEAINAAVRQRGASGLYKACRLRAWSLRSRGRPTAHTDLREGPRDSALLCLA